MFPIGSPSRMFPSPSRRDWKDGRVTIRELIKFARGLKSDTQGTNPEYDRALIEIIVDAAGLTMDDRDLVAKALGIKEVD